MIDGVWGNSQKSAMKDATIEELTMPDEWEGPRTFSFSIVLEHAKTVRYNCPVDNRKFPFYVPKVLLGADHDPFPEKIVVGISRSELPLREIGFRGRTIRPRAEIEFLEYKVLAEKSNSIRYIAKYEGQDYSLYAPYSIFEGCSYPKRLFVYVRIPDGKQLDD